MTVAPDHDSVLPDAAQRRYLTILFSDLSDSTRITSKLEHEHYSDILVDLRRAYQDVIPKHGGTIVQIQAMACLRYSVIRTLARIMHDARQRRRSIFTKPFEALNPPTQSHGLQS
jgi:hypothetical protein